MCCGGPVLVEVVTLLYFCILGVVVVFYCIIVF